MPEAAVIISAEKCTERTVSLFGVLRRSFGTNKRGQPTFCIQLLDHPGEARSICLGSWLRRGIKDIAWSIKHTHFLGSEVSVRA
jgi:hypothetical protein